MATLNPSLTINKGPQLGGHGPGKYPPPGRGGDDSDRNGRDGAPGFYERLRRYRMGVALGLASVIMIFVSLTSAYVVRQGLGTWDEATGIYKNDWKPVPLPDTLLIINTLILLASSITLEMARRSINRHAVTAGLSQIPGVAEDAEHSTPWLGITLILGAAFLGGQLTAWHEMQRAGFLVSSNPSSSFFYVLTGTHAVHLAGGLLALIYAAGGRLLHKSLDSRRLTVDATGWYWHFMGLLWVYIFALLHFSR
jgi:cytochrome c oxidase subunit III